MGDLYVHVQMKECCRLALKALDQQRKKAKFTGGMLAKGSWLKAYGGKTVEVARQAIFVHEAVTGGKLEKLARAICKAICEKHAALHQGKGETEEAELWKELAAACDGKAPPVERKPAGAHGTLKGKGYVVYANEVRSGGSRAWRNNNPGNIIGGKFATSQGAIGNDGRFAIFPDEATGSAALTNLLRSDGYKDLTVADAMKKYAPPAENDTAGYTAAVEKATGLSGDKKMGTLTDEEMGSFTEAIRTHEGWIEGDTYTAESGAEAAPFKKLLGVQ